MFRSFRHRNLFEDNRLVFLESSTQDKSPPRTAFFTHVFHNWATKLMFEVMARFIFMISELSLCTQYHCRMERYAQVPTFAIISGYIISLGDGIISRAVALRSFEARCCRMARLRYDLFKEPARKTAPCWTVYKSRPSIIPDSRLFGILPWIWSGVWSRWRCVLMEFS